MDFFKFFDWNRKPTYDTPIATAPQGGIAVSAYATQNFTALVSGNWYPVASVKLNSSGRPVDIKFQPISIGGGFVGVSPTIGGVPIAYVGARIKRNGLQAVEFICGLDIVLNANKTNFIPMSNFNWMDMQAPAGENTYLIEFQYLSSMSYNFVQGQMIAMER